MLAIKPALERRLLPPIMTLGEPKATWTSPNSERFDRYQVRQSREPGASVIRLRLQKDVAPLITVQATKAIKQSCFASAVGTNKTGNSPFGNVEGHGVERDNAPESDGYVADASKGPCVTQVSPRGRSNSIFPKVTKRITPEIVRYDEKNRLSQADRPPRRASAIVRAGIWASHNKFLGREMPVTEPLDSTVACLRLTVPNSLALNAEAADHLFKSMVPPEACAIVMRGLRSPGVRRTSLPRSLI